MIELNELDVVYLTDFTGTTLEDRWIAAQGIMDEHGLPYYRGPILLEELSPFYQTMANHWERSARLIEDEVDSEDLAYLADNLIYDLELADPNDAHPIINEPHILFVVPYSETQISDIEGILQSLESYWGYFILLEDRLSTPYLVMAIKPNRRAKITKLLKSYGLDFWESVCRRAVSRDVRAAIRRYEKHVR